MLLLSTYTVASQTFHVISFSSTWTHNLPEATVKWNKRRLRSACVFNPSHQGVAFKNRGADWGRLACTLQFDCTDTHVGYRKRFVSVMNLQRWKRDEGKAIRVHHPQLQHGCIILYSSVTKGNATMIR